MAVLSVSCVFLVSVRGTHFAGSKPGEGGSASADDELYIEATVIPAAAGTAAANPRLRRAVLNMYMVCVRPPPTTPKPCACVRRVAAPEVERDLALTKHTTHEPRESDRNCRPARAGEMFVASSPLTVCRAARPRPKLGILSHSPLAHSGLSRTRPCSASSRSASSLLRSLGSVPLSGR